MNNDEAAVAAQAMMNAASDDRDSWRDPMASFRDLLQAQQDALRGDPDDIFPVETRPF